jgi:cobyrinic acid a,c-diamide synthase
VSGGIILAAPASGSGKTIVTLGLLRHLARGGHGVTSAKAGPDYIDPSFHHAASGAPCLNLDSWAMRRATLEGLVAQLECRAEHVICEGAMGLFDGAGTGAAGSTADLAALTGWPVVLVVDARGQGGSVAALVRGFATHRRDVPIAGVILNRVSGVRHRVILEAGLAAALPGLKVFGAVPRDDGLALPDRHLGLVPAGEHGALYAFLDAAADHVATAIDVPALLAAARPASRAPSTGRVQPLPPLGGRIAVARDIAFAFLYPAVLEGWLRGGAELSFFSPLADEAPDASATAIYLPGGYPELHAGTLAGNTSFLAGLREAAGRGATIYGECGGYMVLGEGLIDDAGVRHGMAALLPLVTSFAARRLHLGYRALSLAGRTPLGAAGTAFRGHEFHYASIVSQGSAETLFATQDAMGNTLDAAGLRVGTAMGSFMHLIDRAE